MYNRFVTSDIIAELGRGVLSAHDLRERLGVSPWTLMRLVREAGPKILRIGRGRATQYGLRQTWPNLEGPRFPLFRISESGAAVSAENSLHLPLIRRPGCRWAQSWVGFLPNWLTPVLQVSWADTSQPSMPISGSRPDYRTGLIIIFCSRCLDGEKTYRAI